MFPQRIFNLHKNPKGCALCDAIGLGQRVNSAPPPPEDFLYSSRYTHVGLGCLVDLKGSHPGLKNLKFIHSLDFKYSSGSDYCLLVSDLDREHFRAQAPAQIRWLLLVPQKSSILADSFRRLHPSWIEKLRIYWPHHSQLKAFGWKWSEALDFVRYLTLAFPHLRFKGLEGLDLYNPEVDPELETELSSFDQIDERDHGSSVSVSVIIPTYNNKDHVLRTVTNLMTLQRNDMEVIVVDDGSSDESFQELAKLRPGFKTSQNLVLINAKRPRPRQMGSGSYRAGVSRNCGARMSRGEILLFLDSDILIPSAFIDELVEMHESYDLIQARRIQLTEAATKSGLRFYSEVHPHTDVEAGSIFWETFNSKTESWDQIADKWKYTSTFCLSLKKSRFYQIGGFRRSFSKYGFEDTDLGFRASQLGFRFFLSPTQVYHFKHSATRSEYFNNQAKKESLLRDSCRVFFLANQHIDILNSHGKYLTERI